MRTMDQLHLRGWGALPIAEAILVAAFVFLLGYIAFVAGPAYRASIDRANSIEMSRENVALCGKLGISAPSEAFTNCAKILDEVRAGQHRRTNADMSGI